MRSCQAPPFLNIWLEAQPPHPHPTAERGVHTMSSPPPCFHINPSFPLILQFHAVFGYFGQNLPPPLDPNLKTLITENPDYWKPWLSPHLKNLFKFVYQNLKLRELSYAHGTFRDGTQEEKKFVKISSFGVTFFEYLNFHRPLIYSIFQQKSQNCKSEHSAYVMRCTIWYHLHVLKKVKNTHGRVLLLVKLKTKACNFTKSNTPPWMFFTFFRLHKWYQIVPSISYFNYRVERPLLIGQNRKVIELMKNNLFAKIMTICRTLTKKFCSYLMIMQKEIKLYLQRRV